MEKALKSLIYVVLCLGIGISRLFSVRGACRYRPPCSSYALEAVKHCSPGRALFLIGRRLLRCNPFFRGGYDPLPQNGPTWKANE